jgi:hypothetical protein
MTHAIQSLRLIITTHDSTRYTANRDVCVGHPPNEFTHMGLSVRTDSYRYSEWFKWRADCSPDFNATDGVELYSHVGDVTPGCFDCFENVNFASTPDGVKQHASIIAAHRAMLLAHFMRPEGSSSCPPRVSAEELAATDYTFERTF